jgi:hypothetical protein
MDGSVFIYVIPLLISFFGLTVILLNQKETDVRNIVNKEWCEKNIVVKLKYICKLAEKYNQPLTLTAGDGNVTYVGFPAVCADRISDIYLFDCNPSKISDDEFDWDNAKYISDLEKISIGSDSYGNILYSVYEGGNAANKVDFYLDVLNKFEDANQDTQQV